MQKEQRTASEPSASRFDGFEKIIIIILYAQATANRLSRTRNPDLLTKMISFTSFPLQPGDAYHESRQHPPDVSDDMLMELEDDHDLVHPGGSKLTLPGESLTSSQDYMRSVRLIHCGTATHLRVIADMELMSMARKLSLPLQAPSTALTNWSLFGQFARGKC